MAKITYNPNVAHVHGHVGNWVMKERMGVNLVAVKPDQVHQPNTPAQQQQRGKFKDATVYAKSAMSNLTLRALYSTKAKTDKSSPFAEAVQDWFNPAVVDDIDVTSYHHHVGETIVIRAHDDVQVASVGVVIKNTATQAVIESGAANYDPPTGTWGYAATADASAVAQVTVTVTALDNANQGTPKSVTA